MEEPERITVRDLDADKHPWESYVTEALAAGQAAMGYILRDPQEHAKDWPQGHGRKRRACSANAPRSNVLQVGFARPNLQTVG